MRTVVRPGYRSKSELAGRGYGMNTHTYYHAFLNRDRLVHIVDPDPGTCEALSVLFRLEGFQTIFSLEAAHFLAALERRRPDVAVINLNQGEEDGLSLLRRVKGLRTGAPVIMLANEPQLEAAVTAMKLGATDVLSKPIDSELLLRVVRDALRKDVHLGAMQAGGRPVEVRGFSQLTPREREVLQLITNGQSNKEAGRELGISPRTIEVHRARVMEKLGARNTADLMRIVLTS
ncbi:response regulator [Devosia sp. L53-10-65]|jgi:FixJ family two-component response regulator|uniref:Response regulator n=2 Tax=Devosia marina TaxID=2683198 RepID=A0A7X3FUC1_9HYPH|nr:response regulator [Devosia marina]